MCAVSMVIDYGQRTWSGDPDPLYQLALPEFQPPQKEYIPSKEDWESFKRLVEMAEKFDKETWMKRIEKRLDKLEGN